MNKIGNKYLTYQEQVCIHNAHTTVICLSMEQRQRILCTLRALNVPITKRTFTLKSAETWPHLIIAGTHICGYKKDENDNLKKYTELTEREFINLFIINKFDIYGNLIINK